MLKKSYNQLRLDSKGRLTLPRVEAATLEKKVAVVEGRNELLIMSEKEFLDLREKSLRGLSGLSYNKLARGFGIITFIQNKDNKGRVLVPRALREEIKKKRG